MILTYLILFIGVLIVSTLLSFVTTHLCSKSVTFYRLFHSCFFIGIIVHEVSHYIMCILTHTKVTKTNIIPIRNKKDGLSGNITTAKSNFFQTFLISFAPLFVGTYIIGFILFYIFSPAVNYTIALILIYITISIFLTLSPSNADIRMIANSFQSTNKRYTLIQIIVIFIAASISYYLMNFFDIIIFDSLITLFFLVMLFYYIIRYLGLGLIFIYHNIRISRRKIKYTKHKIEVKNRKKNRGNKFSPRTQW